MAKRGPSKTPTAILQARGSWRAKTRAGEPQSDGVPQPPDWLDGAAKDVWDAQIPMMIDMGIVGRIDANAIARYCQVLAWWIDCKKFIDKYGPTFKNSRGLETEHPTVARAAKLGDQLLRLEREFGLTPAARPGLPLTAKPDDGDAPDGITRFFNPRLCKP
ncbi:MAG: phage terminase small subunit P27 family [Phycisphaeraceae bacterium]